MAKPTCKVVFGHDRAGPFAMSVRVWPSGVIQRETSNAINFPRGTRLTVRKRQAARRALCGGR